MGRAPHGARGLKSMDSVDRLFALVSRPAWGAWIEMLGRAWQSQCREVAPRMGRVD